MPPGIRRQKRKVREGVEWKKIEEEDARGRQALAGGDKISVFAPPLVEIFPQAVTKGKTRDKVADRVGFGSGKTYEKAAKVVEIADKMKEGRGGRRKQSPS